MGFQLNYAIYAINNDESTCLFVKSNYLCNVFFMVLDY